MMEEPSSLLKLCISWVSLIDQAKAWRLGLIRHEKDLYPLKHLCVRTLDLFCHVSSFIAFLVLVEKRPFVPYFYSTLASLLIIHLLFAFAI